VTVQRPPRRRGRLAARWGTWRDQPDLPPSPRPQRAVCWPRRQGCDDQQRTRISRLAMSTRAVGRSSARRRTHHALRSCCHRVSGRRRGRREARAPHSSLLLDTACRSAMSFTTLVARTPTSLARWLLIARHFTRCLIPAAKLRGCAEAAHGRRRAHVRPRPRNARARLVRRFSRATTVHYHMEWALRGHVKRSIGGVERDYC